MKSIKIVGKHNIDRFKNETKRKTVDTWKHKKELLNIKNHIPYINQLYLE